MAPLIPAPTMTMSALEGTLARHRTATPAASSQTDLPVRRSRFSVMMPLVMDGLAELGAVQPQRAPLLEGIPATRLPQKSSGKCLTCATMCRLGARRGVGVPIEETGLARWRERGGESE